MFVIGLWFKQRAEGGIVGYFLTGRKLPWWLAGTSLVATSFASDTPLLITGFVRQNGIAGNWYWWFMALASVATLFFFARLWRRARIVTDLEFIELRYGPGAGAALRGVKAVFMGIIFNVYALGAWPVLGLTKVLQVTTEWPKGFTIIFCSLLALTYSVFAGLWGVVATDFIQFFWAIGGALLLAAFAINAVGGFGSFWDKIHNLPEANFLPTHTAVNFWESPLIFFLSLILIQWWARGVEGDGIAVQRLSACKNEKEAFFSMLWFNIAHYAIRPWPWIIVALVSLIILPTVTNSVGIVDHELAYPQMINHLIPAGLKGFMLASFFAAYMSTVDTHLNWGSSYVVNDLYRRFIKPDASPKHLVLVARIVTVLLMCGGGIIALISSSIVDAFFNVLLLFSGIGLVGIARWFWWRVNAWSEISAMISSAMFAVFASPISDIFRLPDSRPIHLFIVVIGSTAVWLLVTFLTKPTPEENLKIFFQRIRPAGPGWKNIVSVLESEGSLHEPASIDSIKLGALGWCFGVSFILGMTLSIGKLVLGFFFHGILAALIAIAGLIGVVAVIKKMNWANEQ